MLSRAVGTLIQVLSHRGTIGRIRLGDQNIVQNVLTFLAVHGITLALAPLNCGASGSHNAVANKRCSPDTRALQQSRLIAGRRSHEIGPRRPALSATGAATTLCAARLRPLGQVRAVHQNWPV